MSTTKSTKWGRTRETYLFPDFFFLGPSLSKALICSVIVSSAFIVLSPVPFFESQVHFRQPLTSSSRFFRSFFDCHSRRAAGSSLPFLLRPIFVPTVVSLTVVGLQLCSLKELWSTKIREEWNQRGQEPLGPDFGTSTPFTLCRLPGHTHPRPSSGRRDRFRKGTVHRAPLGQGLVCLNLPLSILLCV